MYDKIEIADSASVKLCIGYPGGGYLLITEINGTIKAAKVSVSGGKLVEDKVFMSSTSLGSYVKLVRYNGDVFITISYVYSRTTNPVSFSRDTRVYRLSDMDNVVMSYLDSTNITPVEYSPTWNALLIMKTGAIDVVDQDRSKYTITVSGITELYWHQDYLVFTISSTSYSARVYDYKSTTAKQTLATKTSYLPTGSKYGVFGSEILSPDTSGNLAFTTVTMPKVPMLGSLLPLASCYLPSKPNVLYAYTDPTHQGEFCFLVYFDPTTKAISVEYSFYAPYSFAFNLLYTSPVIEAASGMSFLATSSLTSAAKVNYALVETGNPHGYVPQNSVPDISRINIESGASSLLAATASGESCKFSHADTSTNSLFFQYYTSTKSRLVRFRFADATYQKLVATDEIFNNTVTDGVFSYQIAGLDSKEPLHITRYNIYHGSSVVSLGTVFAPVVSSGKRTRSYPFAAAYILANDPDKLLIYCYDFTYTISSSTPGYTHFCAAVLYDMTKKTVVVSNREAAFVSQSGSSQTQDYSDVYPPTMLTNQSTGAYSAFDAAFVPNPKYARALPVADGVTLVKGGQYADDDLRLKAVIQTRGTITAKPSGFTQAFGGGIVSKDSKATLSSFAWDSNLASSKLCFYSAVYYSVPAGSNTVISSIRALPGSNPEGKKLAGVSDVQRIGASNMGFVTEQYQSSTQVRLVPFRIYEPGNIDGYTGSMPAPVIRYKMRIGGWIQGG